MGVVVVVVSTILINVLLNKCGGLGIGIGQLFTNCHYHTLFSQPTYSKLIYTCSTDSILGKWGFAQSRKIVSFQNFLFLLPSALLALQGFYCERHPFCFGSQIYNKLRVLDECKRFLFFPEKIPLFSRIKPGSLKFWGQSISRASILPNHFISISIVVGKQETTV